MVHYLFFLPLTRCIKIRGKTGQFYNLYSGALMRQIKTSVVLYLSLLSVSLSIDSLHQTYLLRKSQ